MMWGYFTRESKELGKSARAGLKWADGPTRDPVLSRRELNRTSLLSSA